MLIHYDLDEYEPVFETSTCVYHRQFPGKAFAGCCCSASVSQKRRPPEEVAAIKAKRRREEEDSILAQAEAIKASRA